MRENNIKKQDILKDYYNKKNMEEKLRYELNILEENNEKLKCYLNLNLENDELKSRIEKNNRKIIDKQIKINDIIQGIIDIEYIIESLENDEKKLIEMKYRKNNKYDAIELELNISRATITRKIGKILERINVSVKNSPCGVLKVSLIK